jgi:putative ABC transport system substrate-binding protein
MIDRRSFLVALCFAAGCERSEAPKPTTAAPGSSRAGADSPVDAKVQSRIPRVAILIFGSRESSSVSAPVTSPAPRLFRERMNALGYVEGKTVVFEERYADGDLQRLKQLAQDTVAGKPDVIVAIAAAATAAAHEATATIPIVMTHAGDPIRLGWVASLAHPGGNVTGTTSMIPDLGVKQVDLLRELIPGLAKLAVLANSTNVGTAPLLANVRDAARAFNIGVVFADVARDEDFDGAFKLLRDERPDALLVSMEPFIGMNRGRILQFAAANRLPSSFDVGRSAVQEGALISYGPVLTTHYALAAEYVDRILKGANPGDLPVQQPNEFALVINVKTASALGLTVPPSLLARANEVVR